MTAGKGVDAVFQSTLSQGERRKKAEAVAKFFAFQSTLSQGERHRRSNQTY